MKSKVVKVVFLFSIGIMSQWIYSQDLSLKKGSIIVNVNGLKNSKGALKGYLFISDSSFLKTIFKEVKIKLNDASETTLVFKEIPFGTYAINLHHDENENSKLDTNLLGIPKEPYGFSNNVRGKMGPPSFDDTKIEVNSEEMEISITVK